MKKILTVVVLLLVTVAPMCADLIWYEDFNYPDGSIMATSTNSLGTSTNWLRHSGSASPSDAIVSGSKLQVSATGGALSRQDDVNRRFCTADCSYTNGAQMVYASFTVNCTNLPNAAGAYFAHFYIPPTAYYGKVFAQSDPAGMLPNTWRMGISGNANAPSQVFPVDLALNTDYQVVVGYDPVTLWAATLWVNPLSSTDTSVTSNDALTAPPAVQGFAFRQASAFGDFFCTITNLAVATTFDEAAMAVWNTAPVAPVVVYQPRNTTNYAGDSASLSVVANGQSLANLSYQWRKNGAGISNPDGNSNVLRFGSASTADSGNYDVIISAPHGLSVTSSVAYVAITTGPARITQHPTNQTVYFGETARLSVTVVGTPPITYTWYRNNSPLADDATFSGTATNPLTVLNVQADNGTTGTYYCAVSNSLGGVVSSNAILSAVAVPTVSIGYLRTLVDPVFYLPTNTAKLWTATGVVTTWTNVTSAANAQFYMEDDTGGIAVFVLGGSAIRPQAGDSVTVTGPLGQFNSLLELNLATANPAHKVVTNSSGNLLPPGKVLPFSFTNSPAFGGAGEAIRLYQGAVVTLTNVYFVNAGGTFAGGQNFTMTNAAGERFAFRCDARVGDIIGKPIPAHAWTVTGPMAFFLTSTAPDRSAGFQILPTRYTDIVTDPPPQASGTLARVGADGVLTWAAQPFMSYTILRATKVEGPYEPFVSGLTFNTTAGRCTDTNTPPTARFYKIVSP
jgi:hypothetical protein